MPLFRPFHLILTHFFLARGIAEDPQATQEGPEFSYKEVRS